MKKLSFLLLFLFCYSSLKADFQVDDLRVEYTRTPLGIDVENPRFSWQMMAATGERGIWQTAYQIMVRDPEGTFVWDTRKIPGNKSVGISYSGTPLDPCTRYLWTVIVWDQKGKSASNTSWFETGLMDPDPGLSAWDGAKWIGGQSDQLVFQSHFLSVFRVRYTLSLDSGSGSTKASFILGANDSRLLDKNKNIWNIGSDIDSSFIKFELDISSVDGSDSGLAKLNIYRAGYHPGDIPDKPFISADIPRKLINDKNKYEPHILLLESVFGTFALFVDGKDYDHRLQGNFNLNPVGRGGDYIAFPLLADIGFSVDRGQTAAFSNVTVENYREPSNILFSENLELPVYEGIFAGFINDHGKGFSVKNGAYVLNGAEEGSFVTADPGRKSMPMLRTEFQASDKEIKKARLYVTARGIYEIYMNGKRIGKDYFNPGLTQYNITHMYQTYDVTSSVIPQAKNAIGAFLGEGWWSGNITYTGSNWNYFGDRQSLLAKLVITYMDGSETVITTNDRDWKYYNKGPVVYGSFFQGEFYDAQREASIKGWNVADFNDQSWTAAVEIPLKGSSFEGTVGTRAGGTVSFNFDKMSLIGQTGENAGIVKEITAVKVEEVRPGVFVYDMGQNMVGVPLIRLDGEKAGTRIILRYAEMKYPDLSEYEQNTGMIMIENIRAALAQDIYITKGENDIIQPRFTFHGYRFLEITGIEKPLPLESVKGLVISSVNELTSAYVTSDPKVNRLWENIAWSTLGNFLSIPTDCPQRNERMGWSGDISVFSRTATYMCNADQFLKRHLIAMRDVQNRSGKFTDVAPLGGGFGGILWGSAGITLPWEVYQQYGDLKLLEEHYNAMAAYISYLETTLNKNTGLSSDAQLGDWLGPQNNLTGSAILATAYHVFDLEIMMKVAAILGKETDAEKYRKMYKERKDVFNKTFVNADKKTIQGSNGKLVDTQTSYAVGLALNAFDEENIPFMVRNLAEAVERENIDDDGVMRPEWSLMTGFIGTAWISKALSDNGYSELAYRLLQNNQYPSWLYAIDQGATTIWERLNGYTIENGFGGNNSMNSFNHYSFGAVGQWMMAYSLGIQRDEPGFGKFILQPEPDPSGLMTHAKGYYYSMYGRIVSGWRTESNTLIYEATVPANATATLFLPASSVKTIKESGRSVKRSKGVTFLRYEEGKAVYELKSGSYRFISVI